MDHAGFTTVFTGERSKCPPITSLSLLQRKLSVKFISRSEEYGETRFVVFNQEQVESRNVFRQKRFFFRTSTGSRKQRTFFRLSNPENSIKSFFEEHQNYMLAEAKSEVRKQECRAEFLDSSVRDLQRQLDSNLLEIYCANQGYEESRKEQARLHEELAQRERVLRNSDQKYSRSGRLEESSGNANRRNLQERIERKSLDFSGAHFTNTRVARKK